MILCYDAGFVSLGWVAAELPSRAGDMPRIVAGGVSYVPEIESRTRMMSDLLRTLKHVDVVRNLHMMFDPEAYFIEFPHAGAKGARAIRAMALASAYLMTALHMLYARNVVAMLPSAVKKAITGDASADKDVVEVRVRKLWPDFSFEQAEPKKTIRHNLIDAAAVCCAATTTKEYKQLLKKQ